ncbi:hypothetical protein [Allosalinactinospora lopnorensis]|uniref:hypothetical protein n=1 Tax=Allosalinactinospora lopnorensis TaxID=1352348 RepID=UPI0012E15802|nr:hypothetical protein [Allosalinactinospora lopnorensis]
MSILPSRRSARIRPYLRIVEQHQREDRRLRAAWIARRQRRAVADRLVGIVPTVVVAA